MKQLFQTQTSIWRHRDLRLVAGGRAFSFLGDEIAIFALILAVHDAGAGTTGIAALFLAAALPAVLLAPWAGRIGDLHDSRTVLVTAGLLQALLCVGLAFAPTLPVILGLLVALQSVQAVAGPAWASLVPSIVGPADTGRAVGAVQALALMAGIAGPAVAGILVAISGTTLPLLLDAVTFLALAVVGAAVHTRRGGRVSKEAQGPRALDGLRVIRADALMFPMLLGLLAFILFGEITNVVEVFLVRDSLAAGAAAFGVLGAVFAVGAATGSVLGGRAKDDARRTRVAVGMAVLLGVLTVAAGVSPSVLVFGVVWLGLGVCVGVLNVSVSTLVVVRAPETSRAQVIASLSGLTRGCGLLATLAGGLLGLAAGPRTIFVVAGLGALLAAVAMGAAVRRPLAQLASPDQQEASAVAPPLPHGSDDRVVAAAVQGSSLAADRGRRDGQDEVEADPARSPARIPGA